MKKKAIMRVEKILFGHLSLTCCKVSYE